MKISAIGLTHPGLKHADNEDAFLVDRELQLYMVCDGVGGAAAGEVASQTSLNVIHAAIKKNRQLFQVFAKDPSSENRQLVTQFIENAVSEASRALTTIVQKDSSKAGMASTLALLLIIGKHALVAHIGDSRVYLIRKGRQFQITDDHSFVADRIRKGLMTREQAEASPYRHVITRALGMAENVATEVLLFEISAGDTYIVCSDGLCDYLVGQELRDMAMSRPLDRLPPDLIQFANSKGGRDNITVIAVHVDSMALAAEIDALRQLETLRNIPLFRQLSYKETLAVMTISTRREHRTGEVIIQEGEGEEFFIITSGKLEVRKGGDHLATLDSGNFFGEMQLVDNQKRSATVVSLTPGQLLVISRNQFYALLRSEPVLAVKVLWEFCRVLNVRLREVNELFIGEPKTKDEDKTMELATPFPGLE